MNNFLKYSKKKIPKELFPAKKKNYICPVCGNINKKIYFKSIYKDASFPNFTHNKCKFCNSIYIINNISDDQLSYLHDRYYENYENFSFNYFESIKRTEKHRENEWYKYYKNKLSKIKTVEKKNSLDIGCGWGSCVSAFKKLGFDSYGIDPQRQCIVSAKKKFKNSKFYNFGIEDLILNKKFHNFFSVITMHDVLEHIANPGLIIKNIRLLIKKNGYLFIKVPNSESLQVLLLKQYSWEVSAPFHRTLFSKKGLNFLMKKNGFKIIKYFNDSNSWGWTRGLSIKNNIGKSYIKLRNNINFRKFDLSIDLLLEHISKLYDKETVIFLKLKKK